MARPPAGGQGWRVGGVGGASKKKLCVLLSRSVSLALAHPLTLALFRRPLHMSKPDTLAALLLLICGGLWLRALYHHHWASGGSGHAEL